MMLCNLLCIQIYDGELYPELGKVTFKSNGDEALSDESP